MTRAGRSGPQYLSEFIREKLGSIPEPGDDERARRILADERYVITAIPRGRLSGRETIDKTVLPSLDFDFAFSEFWSYYSAGIPGGHSVMVEDLAPPSLPLAKKPRGYKNQVAGALVRLDAVVDRNGLPGTQDVLISWLAEALDAANRERYGVAWRVSESTLRNYLTGERPAYIDAILEARIAHVKRAIQPGA